MIHQIDRKWTVAPSTNFYRKIWFGFCPNTGKRFVSEVHFKANGKSVGSSKKVVPGIFKIMFLCDSHLKFWTFSVI